MMIWEKNARIVLKISVLLVINTPKNMLEIAIMAVRERDISIISWTKMLKIRKGNKPMTAIAVTVSRILLSIERSFILAII